MDINRRRRTAVPEAAFQPASAEPGRPPDGSTRRFSMPFGAELTEGGVRFRLWAPGAATVTLCLGDDHDTRSVSLERTPDGWYGALVPGVGAGTRYRYRINDDLLVPDCASRAQPDGVHGASEVIDPTSYRWRCHDWRGRPWEEAVFYELHVGTFSAAGNFSGVTEKLDYLVDLGVTALELMPVAAFPGRRDWGYNGVSLFAPASSYGRPDALKALIDAAHGRGLMIFLDVVYNHFGPDGNYIGTYAPQFFKDGTETPWGVAMNFDHPDSGMVRQFFIANALYWIEEYFIDGLRLDAVHALVDDSDPSFLADLAHEVQQTVGDDRHVHLVLENDDNDARLLARDAGGRPGAYTAQWNDDCHHALHVLLTAERASYYADYAEAAMAQLARCLSEGFAFQGDISRFRGGERRGQPSAHLPPTAFVNFLQNHDQIGNRALGERITQLAPWPRVRAAVALLLLAPSIPLIFMGEEWAADQPFLFFCNLGPELEDSVRAGRRREFGQFPEFASPAGRARIPDPTAAATTETSRLDWQARTHALHAEVHACYRELLAIRKHAIVPWLAGMRGNPASASLIAAGACRVAWKREHEAELTVIANLSTQPLAGDAAVIPEGRLLYATPGEPGAPWQVRWYLTGSSNGRGEGGDA